MMDSKVNSMMLNSMKKSILTSLPVFLLLAGCSREPAAPAQNPASTRAPGLKIAMIAKSSTNPVFLSARTGAEAAAREMSQKHGVPVEIVWMTPPSEDGQVQAQRIAQAV